MKKPTESQRAEAVRLLHAGKEFIDNAVESVERRYPGDNPAALQAGVEALDYFSRNDLEEARLRERITEDQRDDIELALDADDGAAAMRIDPDILSPGQWRG